MADSCGLCDTLITASTVMACLSTVAVGLRFLSRRVTNVPLMMDDWFILAALPFSWLECILNIEGVIENGLGRHFTGDWTVLSRGLFATYFFQLIYCFAVTLPKFSILALYWRVFGMASFKWPLIATAVLTLMFFVGTFLTAVFSCIPVYAFWDLTIQGNCLNPADFWTGQAAVNIPLDVILILLPIIPIRKLQISGPQKIAVGGIFSLGIFVTICSALRFNALIQMLNDNTFDPTYTFVPAALWSALETNLSVVCVCLPSMRPLLRVILSGSFRAALTRTTSSNANHPQPRNFTPGVTNCFSACVERGDTEAPWRPIPADQQQERSNSEASGSTKFSGPNATKFAPLPERVSSKIIHKTTVIELVGSSPVDPNPNGGGDGNRQAGPGQLLNRKEAW